MTARVVVALTLVLGLAPSATALGNGRVAFISRADLVAVNVDGTGRQRLWTAPPCPPSQPHFCWPEAAAWSPDGSRLAFVAFHSGLRLLDADGSGERRLVPDVQVSSDAPVWSPDGTRVAFMSETYPQGVPRHDLYVVDVDSGSFRALTDGASAAGPPSWSSDGDEIAVVDRAELVVVKADGSSRKTLIPRAFGRFVSSPAWSSHDEIAYTRSEGPSIAVHTIKPDGTGDRLLASVRGRPRAWSRNGEILLMDEVPYPSNGRSPIDGTRLFRVTRNSELIQLTHEQNSLLHNRHVSWSPDESFIAFSRIWSVPETPPVVMTANADGTCERRLAVEAYTPAWQPVQEGQRGERRCTELRVLPEGGPL